MIKCPRCGEPMTGGICDNCGFPMTVPNDEESGLHMKMPLRRLTEEEMQDIYESLDREDKNAVDRMVASGRNREIVLRAARDLW